MKKFGFIILMLIGFTSISFAQQEEAITEAEEEKVANEPRDRFMINITLDNIFHKEDNGFDTKWSSRGIGLYYMYDIPIKKSRVSIAPGIGFTHSSLYHNSFMVEDSSGTDFNPIDNFNSDDDFKAHKLGTNYFEVPVELRFYSKPTKNGKFIKAALGFRAGVKLTAINKEKNKVDGVYKKYKTKGYGDVGVFRGGPTFRIGYGGFNVFAYYSATNLFKKNRGPEMRPFSIGISITNL